MAIALNTVIVDGQEYKPGDVIPDFKSIKCVDTREPRKYQGLSADVSVLNDVIAKYASGGASCFMSDTGEYYEYDRKEKTFKLITNITERGFGSEKAYGALKHMLKNVSVSDEKIQSAVTDYLRVNPVLPGATTEQAQQIEQNKTDIGSLKTETGSLKQDLDNKIEHVGGYKEYDIGTPSVGTYWNKSAKKQLESETYQSFNPISLKAGTYHYENMSGSFTFYEDTDGNWIPIGKYSVSGNGDVVITNDTTMYITEMQKSGVFVGAKLYSGDITQKESNWFKNPKYNIDNINNTLESLSDSVNDIKSIDGSVIKEYCIYVSTTGSDTSGDGSEEKPFATIYHANETITDNSYAKRYRIIVLPGTYTDLQDKYTGITPTGKYQGVITKPWVTYESKSGNPKDTIIEWDGSTGLENPTRDDVVEKCAFHIVSLPRTFTAIKGFTIKSKNTRYAMHCESSGMGIQGEWLIENCIFDWGGCTNISDDTGRFPAIGIGMSPCEKGTIKFCKIVTTTVETMLVHDGKKQGRK